ncbi:acyl-CoA thioesterase II [Quadrisphaera sp. DSM 44207]|uniref:acyl-CoA thioesterase n=1 Tax=Quadrisphaera sp. DSM 44207 TaxID=1881057 RepID=UPI00088A32DF|nr:acyl-CoA thioesterase II [Quadrisphaera sp. DSM 44207]SDQ06383.1 acyl-CoA thioesterase-2 [Quadrisphaera sp. DSM 44207]
MAQPPAENVPGPLAGLLAVLDLQERPRGVGGVDVFTGLNTPRPWGRVFGGQVLAQALVAATRTAPPERPAHSMHAYFLRPGDPDTPITFTVERLRDGRSFSARRVQASQQGAPILSAIASFQSPDEGLDHGRPMPQVPGPEELPTTADLIGHLDDPVAQHWSHERPVDLRHVDGPLFLDGPAERTDAQAVWMRAVGALPDDDGLHRAVTAYASDYTVLEPVLRRHGLAWAHPGLRAASIDHAMWWHRPARADEWLLYVQTSPSASGGRGLGQGLLYSRDGALVATVLQEGMVRTTRG